MTARSVGATIVSMKTVGERRLIDLSHPIEEGMVTYPKLPGPEFSAHLSREQSRASYAPGTEFHIGRISMVGNTGTYVDSPFHRFADGTDLAGLPLERLADLPAVRISVPIGQRAIDLDDLTKFEVTRRAVLLHTDWDRHWRTDYYFSGHPYVTAAAADWLVEQGAALVGIDSLNIDDTDDPTRPAHTRLLAAGIPIVEHLANLAEVPVEGSRFSAVPAPVVAFATLPVRAYVVIPGRAL